MSGYITNDGENFLLDLICGASRTPDTLWVALLTKEPSKYVTGGEISEPEVSEYSRIPFPNQSGNWSARSGEMTNMVRVATDEVSGNETWPALGWWGILDAPHGGRLLWAGSFANPVVPVAGDVIAFPPGSITIRTASYLSRTSVI